MTGRDISPATARAILFDWDMTLVDNWGAIHHALNATLEAMGHDTWTFEETRARVRESMRDSFPRLFGDRWRDAGAVFNEAFRSHHLDGLRPLPGAHSGLLALRTAGLYLGIVSNKHGDVLRHEVAHLGWRDFFSGVVGAGDAARDKPAPEPVTLALSAGGPEPGTEVWFVGDTGIDMQCARAAGCVPILIGPADPLAAEFRASPPALTVPDVDALVALVHRGRNPIS